MAAAPREDVAAALDELDRVFEEVTGRPAVRAEDDSGGGRTVAYLDCMRDLDVTLGPAVLDELRASLPPVLYASRWWCGRVFDRGAELLGRIAHGRSGPLAPLLGELMGAGFGLWNQMGAEQDELQRRWASVVAAARRADAFADWTPAWHGSGLPLRRPPDRGRRAPRRSRAATSWSCSATSTAATTRSRRGCSACATPTRRRCCAASPPSSARASTSRRRAAAWSR